MFTSARAWLHDLAFLLGGWVVALGLLAYLHGSVLALWALGLAVLAVGFRRLIRRSYSNLPAFLTRPLDVGVVLLSLFVAAVATMVAYPWAYWVLRWVPALSLAAASAVLMVWVPALVYTHRRLANEVELQELRIVELREAALQARYRALQAQVNPHFLFNALNTLAEVVHEDAGVAEQMVEDLAGMMRLSLSASTEGPVPLADELDLVRRYLRLESQRLGSRLRFELVVEPGLDDVRIPGLLLQPLVENAVHYAAAARVEGGRVLLSVSRQGERLRCVVEDDGPGLPPGVLASLDEERAPTSGTGGAGGGLFNVRRRLALHYRDQGQFGAEALATGGTRITLELPLEAP